MRIRRRIFLLLILCCLYGLFFNTKWINDLYNVYIQIPTSQTQRKENVKLVCEQYNKTFNASYRLTRFVSRQLYVEHTHKLIYCEVPKVGCTNWKRIILFLFNKSLEAAAEELEHFDVHRHASLVRLSSYSHTKQEELLKNYTKVMFVRDPLQRLVSAYRDKFLHQEDVYYYKTIGRYIKTLTRKNVNSTEKITFPEFARYIIKEDVVSRDTHWKPMHELCDPCNIQYDIVGKFETMKQDSDFVLRTIHAPKNLHYPSIRHYPNESRTNAMISQDYFSHLNPKLFKDLMNVYKVDFSMFQYHPATSLRDIKSPKSM
uniref:Carbohydrate sulfotransferase n=1 Tax=Leptobrachium leishanense TaxID=445787 RepID=A0A8C5WFW9_9ANUR